jgi:hypothetical protein
VLSDTNFKESILSDTVDIAIELLLQLLTAAEFPQ